MSDTISVTLLDRDYQVACTAEMRPALEAAAASLDKRLREIRSSGTVVGLERIAIMAALNLSFELQQVSTQPVDEGFLQNLDEKLDRALTQLS